MQIERVRLEVILAETNNKCSAIIDRCDSLSNKCGRRRDDFEMEKKVSKSSAIEGSKLRAQYNELSRIFKKELVESTEIKNKAAGLCGDPCTPLHA